MKREPTFEPPAPSAMPPPWTLHGDALGLLVGMPAGGVSLMLFVRYHDSNVGPYDELLWLDTWRRTAAGRRHSVTRIYVSTEASLSNGRRNWAIPKELARFAVTPLSERAQRVEVLAQGRRVAAFSCCFGRWFLPVNFALVPARWRTLVQVSDAQRLETAPSARGRLHAARFSELVVEPALFPDASRGRTLGAFSLRGFEMTFPPARVVLDRS